MIKQCKQCKNDFTAARSRIQFCSTRCQYDAQRRQVEVTCAYCGTTFSVKQSIHEKNANKSGMFFCGRSCKEQAQISQESRFSAIIPSHYGTGKHNYRPYLMRRTIPQCARCGYNDKSEMIDVDHIDGDRLNRAVANLRYLCVWCHALRHRLPDEFAVWPCSSEVEQEFEALCVRGALPLAATNS